MRIRILQRCGQTLGAVTAAACIIMAATPGARAQGTPDAPRVQNARVDTKALTGPLATEIQHWAAASDSPRWLAYSVEETSGDRTVCCGGDWNGSNCNVCRLEDHHKGDNVTTGDSTLKLEGSRRLVILFRVAGKTIMKIREASLECSLDVGGLPFEWLTGVPSGESVDYLATYVRNSDPDSEHGDRSTSNGALAAIAMHAGPKADQVLDTFVQPQQSESLRRQASFWMGEARGKAGLVALQKMARNESSPEVRAQVTFALSVSREPAALDEMIRMARSDESSHVRGQALFWLAHKAGEKAVGTITGAIDNDPDTEVKKKAVFALSQLPKEEGVPKLIEVAESNRNLAVRKQAIFWLGQSDDARALAFFEKVLSR